MIIHTINQLQIYRASLAKNLPYIRLIITVKLDPDWKEECDDTFDADADFVRLFATDIGEAGSGARV